MTDQTPDLAALEALAEAATPGPWTAYGMTGVTSDDYEVAPEYHYTCDGCASEVIISPIIDHETAAFIAAADPATVLWLIREVERLRESIAGSPDKAQRLASLVASSTRLVQIERDDARARAEKAEARLREVSLALSVVLDTGRVDHNGHPEVEGEPDCGGCWWETVQKVFALLGGE